MRITLYKGNRTDYNYIRIETGEKAIEVDVTRSGVLELYDQLEVEKECIKAEHTRVDFKPI